MFLLRRITRKNKIKLNQENARRKILEDRARLEEQKRLDRIYIKKAVEHHLAKTDNPH